MSNLSKGDKARAIGRLFDQNRDGDAYRAIEWLLLEREWPQWLRDVCIQIDGPKDLPVNIQEAA